MRILLASLLLFIASLFALSSAEAAGEIASTKRLAIISAIDPTVHGQKVGLTAFQNHTWSSDDTGFDINATALATLKANLKREARLVDGETLGLIRTSADAAEIQLKEKELTAKLAALGQEWRVDTILIIHTRGSESRDWMGETNQRVKNFGIYARGYVVAHCNLSLMIFDCTTQRFARQQNAQLMQSLPSGSWRETWSEYTAPERRVVLHGLGSVTENGTRALFSKVGLTDYEAPRRSIGQSIFKANRGASWVPDGNDLEIPEGVSIEAAHAAVIEGFERRKWTVTTNTPDKIVGSLVESNKEAVATVTFNPRSITVVPERFQLHANGQRERIDPHLRWTRNLKESILRALFKATAEE
jgi:hypothetical protein